MLYWPLWLANVPRIFEANGEKYIEDPESGERYLLDPNRRVLPLGPSTDSTLNVLGKSAGALLTEARPLDFGLYTYVASSKSHKSSDPHHLHVYAIGLRLTGVTRNNLWQLSNFRAVTSEPSETPLADANSHPLRTIWLSASTMIRSGYVLTCPGARSLHSSGSGRLLYGILPEPDFHGGSWAYSKDHLTSSAGVAYADAQMVKKSF